MSRWSLILLFSISALSIGPAARGGEIDPALDLQLDLLPPDGTAAALVLLERHAPVRELSLDLTRRGAGRSERNQTIVRALREAAAAQDPLLAHLDAGLRSGEVDGYTSYWIVNGVVVRATAPFLRSLALRPEVAWVGTNPEAELIRPVGTRSLDGGLRGIGVAPGQRAIRADSVWHQLGITGRGRIVANIDTGVDGTHPALASRWRGAHGHPYQECWLDLLLEGDTNFPEDSGEHGTHVMGTLTGLGAETGDTIGVAWGAQWIACNAIGQGANEEFDNDILTAFQWLSDPDGDPSTIDDVPDVVQNSWRVHEGFPGYEDCDPRWWEAIDNCEAAGVVVIFSAGNEGPDPMTIGSPPDRTTTPLNCFAVGAVDATNHEWPYPIAGFSSRGPSGCEGNEMKPEVVAPGVDVYSSVPGGGYEQLHWSGTSMAGPHVSGIVALMREANPDLEVDTIKQILIDTARDQGDPGEDNDYGWGFVDALAAVRIAIEGTGALEGMATNLTDGGTPIPGVVIGLMGSAAHYPTDEQGVYFGRALAGSYIATARHPSFAEQQAEVEIALDGVTVQDFVLEDIAGPEISGVSDPRTIPDEAGPYEIAATIADFSAIVEGRIVYRVGGGIWLDAPMIPSGDLYTGEIPGQAAGNAVDFYIEATDVGGNVGRYPPDAPDSYRTFWITLPLLVDDMEADRGWTAGWPGDTATAGFWVRVDPVGTWVGGRPAQPEDDHTPDPGHLCYVTGNGEPGEPAGAHDVDGGCTSLGSPTLDFSGAEEAPRFWYDFRRL